jgi:hypothetical protein
MPLCDGCGAQVDDAHIRLRIERLELATRFRPIHISVLLIDAGPPERLEDYFYRPAANRSDRSPASAEYFDALMKATGIEPGSHPNEEAALAAFQRRGFFLVGATDCPPETHADKAHATRPSVRAIPTILRRIRISYKPKSIALLSPETEPLLAALLQDGWSAGLILDNGKPFQMPAQAEALAKALAAASAPKAHA